MRLMYVTVNMHSDINYSSDHLSTPTKKPRLRGFSIPHFVLTLTLKYNVNEFIIPVGFHWQLVAQISAIQPLCTY